MSQLFSRNAYSVLGLDTRVSQKEISKRSKEIVRLLKIDHAPEYDNDLRSITSIDRDEATVNDAVQRLSSPIKRIQEYFFWFEIENDQDEKSLELLRYNQYDEALERWQKRAEKSLTAKKNFAIACSILLNHTGYKKYLKMSIDAWSDVVNSDKFWSHFEKVYALNDEIGTSKSAIDGFRGKVLEYLSDFYSDVSRKKKDKAIYASFGAAFGTKGQKIQDEILAPLFEQINSVSEQMLKLNASKNDKLSPSNSRAIDRLINKLQASFQEIKDLGLYNDSQSKIMRDKAAEAINIVAVDLFNNLDENDKALSLLIVSKSLATGPAVISMIKKNFDYIKQVNSHRNITEPINNLIEKENYQEALDLIAKEKTKHKADKALQTYFTSRIQWCVTAITMHDFNEAKRLFEANNFLESESLFSSIYDYIYSHIEDFDLNKEALNSVLEIFCNMLDGLSTDTIDDVDNYREQILENSNLDKETSLELPIITMLLDSAIYQRMSQLIPEIRRRNRIQVVKNMFWKIIGWIIVVAVVAAIGGAFDGGSNSLDSNSGSGSVTPSNSAWQTCSNEYNSLKSQLDSVEYTMKSFDASGDVEAYNALVPEQNSLVQQVNNKAVLCNSLR